MISPGWRSVENRPLEEILGCDAALAGLRGDDDGGTQRHNAGRQLSRRIGQCEAAADGAAVADGGMGDERGGLGQKRGVSGNERVTAEIGMARQGADAQGIALDRNALQGGNPGDIDQPRGFGQAERECREQALAAGQDLRLGTGLVHDAPEIRETFDAGIAHRRPLHDTSPTRCRRSVALRRRGSYCLIGQMINDAEATSQEPSELR